METMGERVRKLRKEKRLTVTELAQQTGFSRSAIVKIESGSRSRTCDRYARLAKALGCRIDDLFPEMDEVKTDSADGFDEDGLDDLEL